MTASSTHNRPDPDAGVSEIIGSVLLISLVVLAVGIIAMLLFSQTTPQKIPNINFMTGSDDRDNLYLLHNGGDSLTNGTFDVRVDNDIRKYEILEKGDEWSLGKNLIIRNVPSGPHSITIVYNNSGNGAVVLRSAQSDIVNSTSGKSSDSLRIPSYPPVIPIPQLMQNATSGTVIFYREKNAAIVQSPKSFLNFTVTTPNSTMSITDSCITNPLIVGSTISITQTDSVTQGFRIAGNGNQIWELTADKVRLVIQNSSGVYCNKDLAINHTLINGYSNFRSNLTVRTDLSGARAFTALTIYNYVVNTTPQSTSQLLSSPTTDSVEINNISPNNAGFIAFYFDNTTKSAYFAGNPSRVMLRGSQQYPP